MKKRPVSISIIAWFFIVTSPLSLAFSVIGFNNPAAKQMMSQNPMPIPIQLFITGLGLVITFVSGIAMLKGLNWSRYLYVVWSGAIFVLYMIMSPFKVMMIPGILVLLVIAFFLFRPKANEFFHPEGKS